MPRPASAACLVRRECRAAESRLLCLPHAGGGPSAFRGWFEYLPEGIELCVVNLPGRERRFGEPFAESLCGAVKEIAEALGTLAPLPLSIFGHSLGAILGYELSRALERERVTALRALYVAGCRAPHLPRTDAPIHALPDRDFLAKLAELGGMPTEVVENDELMSVLLPILRADSRLADEHTHRPGPPIAVPIIAYGGVDDTSVTRSSLEAWRSHSSAGFRCSMFPGGHFFIDESRSSVLRDLSSDLATPTRG